jgi:hypothetical protein
MPSNWVAVRAVVSTPSRAACNPTSVVFSSMSLSVTAGIRVVRFLPLDPEMVSSGSGHVSHT